MKPVHVPPGKNTHALAMGAATGLLSESFLSHTKKSVKQKTATQLDDIRPGLSKQFEHKPSYKPAKPRSTIQNPALNRLTEVTSLLLLQGPIGSFFDRITNWKKSCGHQVHRIVFNGGDALYCRKTAQVYYNGSLASWSGYLQSFIKDHAIDGVLLFGQTRVYHAIAIELCQSLGIPVFVLEEGYIRPGFLTLELGGVNSYSTSLRKFSRHATATSSLSPAQSGKHEFFKCAMHAMAYYVALVAYGHRFRQYQHHRHTSLTHYASYWIKTGLAKLISFKRDTKKLQALAGVKAYFFVPLQLDTDSQVTHHSPYNDCFEFLEQVMRSFSLHAPSGVVLVIKQHPLARGKWGVAKRVADAGWQLGITKRIIFIQDCHLPTLIRGAAGVVTINSTVGLQVITHGRPLKVMGQAIYESPGITDSQPLDFFWIKPLMPNPDKAKSLHHTIKIITQIPGTLYESANVPLPWQGNGIQE